MAKGKVAKDTVVTPEEVTAEVGYSTMSKELILEAIGKAYAAKDMKLMAQLSKLYTKKEGEEEKAKKEALLGELIKVTAGTLGIFTSLTNLLTGEKSGLAGSTMEDFNEELQRFLDSGVSLDGAEGIWFAYDFGAVREKGINPSCKLVKTSRKAVGEGASSGKSSYVANPAKSADILAQVGENVMFRDSTSVTIDKVEHEISAGTTFKEAYDYSTNGGWRNRVRMALLKEAGII